MQTYIPPHLRTPEHAAQLRAADEEVARVARDRKRHDIGDTPEDTQIALAYCAWRTAGHQGALADFAHQWRLDRGKVDDRRIAGAMNTTSTRRP